jgi:hypothetical protein
MGKRIKEFDRGFEAGKQAGVDAGYDAGYKAGHEEGISCTRRFVVRTLCKSINACETLVDVDNALEAAFNRCRSEGLLGALRVSGLADWLIDGVSRGPDYSAQLSLLEMACLCSTKSEERMDGIKEVAAKSEVRAIQAETKVGILEGVVEDLKNKVEDLQEATVITANAVGDSKAEVHPSSLMTDAEMDLVRERKLIAAVKAVRNRTGDSLKAALNIVRDYQEMLDLG